MSTLDLCFNCYYVAVLCVYVFEKFKWYLYLSVCHYCPFLSIDLLCYPGTDEAGTFYLQTPVHFYWISSRTLGPEGETSLRRGMTLATSLRCSLAHSQPQPASSSCRGLRVQAHAQVGRDTTGRHALVYGAAENWLLAVEKLHGCVTENLWLWPEKLTKKFFFRNPGSQGHSVPKSTSPPLFFPKSSSSSLW